MPESSPAACRFAIRDKTALCFLLSGLLNIDSALTLTSFWGRDDADGFFFAIFILHAIYVDNQQDRIRCGSNARPLISLESEAVHASAGTWKDHPALPDRGKDRSGRNGRGVQGRGPEAGTAGGDQSTACHSYIRRDGPHAPGAGGAFRLGPQSSQYRHHTLDRRFRGFHVRRNGVHRG